MSGESGRRPARTCERKRAKHRMAESSKRNSTRQAAARQAMDDAGKLRSPKGHLHIEAFVCGRSCKTNESTCRDAMSPRDPPTHHRRIRVETGRRGPELTTRFLFDRDGANPPPLLVKTIFRAPRSTHRGKTTPQRRRPRTPDPEELDNARLAAVSAEARQRALRVRPSPGRHRYAAESTHAHTGARNTNPIFNGDARPVPSTLLAPCFLYKPSVHISTLR